MNLRIDPRIVGLSLALLLGDRCLTGQSRAWSGVAYIGDDGVGSVLQDEDRTRLEWRWAGVGAGRGSLTMPFDRAGSICLRSPDRVLVAGVASSTGLCSVVELHFRPGADSPRPTTCFSGHGVDFSSMHFDAVTGSLFVLEHGASTVSVATLRGSTLGARVVVADASNCTLLRDDCPYPVDLLPLPSGAPGVRVTSMSGSISSPEYEITRTSSGWTLAVLRAPHPALPSVWVTEPRPYLSAEHDAYLIEVSGGQGPFGVIDAASSKLLFVADHDRPPDAVQVFELPVASAALGAQVFLRSLAGQRTADSAFMRLQPEWERESMPCGELQAGPLLMRWDLPAVGTALAAWSLRWDGPTPPPSGAFSVTMLVGDWQFGQSPTTTVGGLDVLATRFGDLGPLIATFDPNGRAPVGVAIRTQHPALHGAQVAMQAVGVTDRFEPFCSNVLGAVLD